MDDRDMFITALREDPAKRAAFLDEACRGDLAARRRVEALLDAHETARGRLDTEARSASFAMNTDPAVIAAPGAELAATAEHSPTALATSAGSADTTLAPEPAESISADRKGPRPITEGPGTSIGPYKLVQKIGEGGMGSVYIAEQERPVRRRVALKIIKAGMDTDQFVARFEAERQALALMDHPSIARVFDAGTTDTGRPFFVMELVDGVPITDYCDKSTLSTERRLELFMPVCQAIQHAHQKGIIHRDIKPSNVMVTLVDGKPVPKVIDFGVAKAINQRLTEKTMFTQFGSVVGTLEYMSPEQADVSGLDVDTRSDIYALGVMLYELLTGSTPLERNRLRQAAYLEILKRIKDEEPPKPSTRLNGSGERLASIAAQRATEPRRLTRSVRGDLDWIVMKALEKDRSRRYETANGFARDIQRFLDGDPVEACPPSTAYRVRKFVRKHRAALVTVATFAAMLVAMSMVSTWQAIRATSAERRANEAALRAIAAEKETGSERDRARRAEAEARTEAESARRSAAESEAVRKFLEDDLLAAARPAGQGGGLGKDATIRQAVDRVRPHIAAAFKNQPTIEAAVRSTLGTTELYLSNYTAAIRELERAVELRKAQLGADHPSTLGSRSDLAVAYLDAGQTAKATPELEEVLKLQSAKLGADHPDALHTRNDLALAYKIAGRTADSLALSEETLRLKTKRLGPDDPDTLLTRNNLAEVYLALGRTDDAIAMHEETLRLETSKLGPDHPETLVTRNNLAGAYGIAGRTAEAIAMHEETLKLRILKLGSEHVNTLHSRNNLALAYLKAGRTADAIAMHEETLRLKSAQLGADHPDTLTTRNNLAQAYVAGGRTAQAIAMHEDTLKQRISKLGPDHPRTLASRHSLAAAYRAADRPSDAIAVWEAMLPVARKVLGAEHPNTLTFTNSLATTYESIGQWAQAAPLRRELIATRRKSLPADSPVLAADLVALGSNLLEQKDWAEAEQVLREALKIDDAKRPDDWSTFEARSLLGASLMGEQKYAEAEPLIIGGYEGLSARAAKLPTKSKMRLSEAAERVVRLYEAWGKKEKANEWRNKLGLKTELPANGFER
jgi:eukaryotic-like serine/threonine-protein kinase